MRSGVDQLALIPPPRVAQRGAVRVLALDLGRRTGWSTNYPAVESGVQEFDLRRGESPGMRFLRFRGWLREMVSMCDPELLVYEIPHHRGGAATELLVGMSTRVQEVAAELGLEHQGVHTGTLKKHATGNGGAGKPEMMAAARRDWPGQRITTNDQADALCVLRWALDEVGR